MNKMPATVAPAQVIAPGTVHRKCACAPGSSCHCNEREHEKENIGIVQRRAAPGSPSAGRSLAPPLTQQIQAAAARGGSPLPHPVRRTLEPRLGNRDLSVVRVHEGAEADALARGLHADAFTTGNHIFFAANRLDYGSPAGQHLLGHEIAHVLQQGGDRQPGIQPRLTLGSPDTAAEREAEHVADALLVSGGITRVTPDHKGIVRRACTGVTAGGACLTQEGSFSVIDLPASEPLLLDQGKADSSTDLAQVKGLYDALAAHHSLQTTHALHPDERSTEELWSYWRAPRNLTAEEFKEVRDQARDKKCDVDHIVELQVGGTHGPSNLRPLNRDRNQRSGRELDRFLTATLDKYMTQFGLTGNRRVADRPILRFNAVQPKLSTSPDPDPCVEIQRAHPAGAGAVPKGQAQTQFKVGGIQKTIGYLAGNGEVHFAFVNEVPQAELSRVDPKKTPLELYGRISHRIRRPAIRALDTQQLTMLVQDGVLRMGTDYRQVKFLFPYLSDATLTPDLDTGRWTGTIVPSLPLLRQTVINFAIENEQLVAALQVPADALQRALPIPGLRISNCNLGINIAASALAATGGFDFAYGTMATGRVEAAYGRDGFSATGNIDLHIPGIDEARGEAHVRGGKFGASLRVGAGHLKFPGVQSAAILVTVEDGQLNGTGAVHLAIPGLDTAILTFTANSQGQYTLAGTATGHIPGTKDVRLDSAYANGALSGKGHAALAIPGLETSAIDLSYANGEFSGAAMIAYRRGRLSGTVQAALSPKHKLSGHGELSYEIAPGLVAIGLIDLREDGTAKFGGEVRLPDPIELFKERGFNKNLFSVSLEIPIFGISFGPRSIGIIAKLSAGINASAGIGPGQIRQPKILAAFDPSNDQSALSFQASGELYVPAHADISVFLAGGIGASLLIVEAVGGLRATATAGLVGALSIPARIQYLNGKITLDGSAEIYAQPRLRFDLDAFVEVTADLWVTTIDVYSHKWNLASYEWGTDFRIGLLFPFHYAFGEPFDLSLNQIQFIAPRLDAMKLLKDLLPA